MCFVQQRRALFRQLNFQKSSECEVFLAFSLANVLRATTACTFSTSQIPKVVRSWCVLCILTWKCAWRHNGVHFFDISISKSGPSMWCFMHFDLEMCFAPPAALASLLFDPPEPHIFGKTQCFATFLPFRALGSSFFWDFLFSDLLSSSLLFSILLLHLCFSSVHIVGSLTSKLPSTIWGNGYNMLQHYILSNPLMVVTWGMVGESHRWIGTSNSGCRALWHSRASVLKGGQLGFNPKTGDSSWISWWIS